MNWQTGFDGRSQVPFIGRKRAANCVVAHSSRLRCFSNAVVGSKGGKGHHPICSQSKIPLYAAIR